MDPNANLAEQRRLIAAITNTPLSPLYTDADQLVDLHRVLDLAQALDQWMSRGGFLPDAWAEGIGRNVHAVPAR